MAVWWRKLAIAGIAGFACGRTVKYARSNPETAQTILKCSAFAGLAGLVVGAGYGAYRGRPMYVYSLSLGANLSAVAVVFLGVREVVVQRLQLAGVDTKEEAFGYIPSATSGGVTGLAIASVARLAGLTGLSIFGALSSVTSGTLLGTIGQYGWNKCDDWRREKAIALHYPELLEDKGQRKKWSWKTFERKFLEFAHKESGYSSVQEEILALEEAIAEEKAAVELLNQSMTEGYLQEAREVTTADVIDPTSNPNVTQNRTQS